jgi:hypothetical protein
MLTLAKLGDIVGSKNVQGVERAENWCSIIVGREVRPSRYIWEDGSGVIEEDSPRQDEGEIAQKRGDTLKLFVNLVENTSVVGRPCGWIVCVCGHQVLDFENFEVGDRSRGEKLELIW